MMFEKTPPADSRQEIVSRLKKALAEELNLEDVKPEELTEETVLFGQGLGLDSIDAVELVVLLEKRFGVAVKGVDEVKAAFRNIGALADFIVARMGGK